MGEGHGGVADFVMFRETKLLVRSFPAKYRITSIMRAITSPQFSQVALSFVATNTGPTSGTTTIASTLRIHHGAPTVVFAHVTEVLQGMGLENAERSRV
ncbi:hypothetical protein Clacol_003369 [Clathrus columnatus]|uniref:Uncharacterized protein n=1 Tax=Clathrus columnatus TaxID=1419009 RepID=A0AAV5A6L5_9AGAM|nr:hypothetical protein Clacol_003369 [Clathrus columnatus]